MKGAPWLTSTRGHMKAKERHGAWGEGRFISMASSHIWAYGRARTDITAPYKGRAGEEVIHSKGNVLPLHECCHETAETALGGQTSRHPVRR